MTDALEQLQYRVAGHLQRIYHDVAPDLDIPHWRDALIDAMGLNAITRTPPQHQNHWSERDTVLITYADTFRVPGEKPLETLVDFLDMHVAGVISGVHILPFFPSSSDAGFAVIDYEQVSADLGDWSHIKDIASRYRLMADLVINHCSSEGRWFRNFMDQTEPGKDYFFCVPPDADLSQVVRPRTNPLLRKVETAAGERYVWCTFSHDQVDLDFRNPRVLLEFVRIIRHYLECGVRIFRLDAIAFLWKVPGTTCLNLAETHEVVRLLRTLVEHAQRDAVLITETNIPNRENLSYFGNGNEAHCVYNFSLPPLLVNTLLTGDGYYLKQWLMSMPPAQQGTTYFNFVASHDGIGLRPLEGLLSDDEVMTLVDAMQRFGGRVSWRALNSHEARPYEINITLMDALKGTVHGEDTWQLERFVCAHAIMLALEGIPGLYVHSLLGTENDYARLAETGENRTINRHQWDYAELQECLADGGDRHTRVYASLKRLLALRTRQPAFHPNATQFTLQLGNRLIGFWRQSLDRRQSIFCISNIDHRPHRLPLTDINLVCTDDWFDLISGQTFPDLTGELTLAPYQTVWLTNRLAGDDD